MRMLPVQNIATALNKVTYPTFAAIQHDNEKLKIAYRKLMQQVIFWITPLMIILMIAAEPLLRFLLTDKWLPAVPYFQILCVSAILYPLQVYNLNILNVKGRSDLFLKLEVIKKIVVGVGIVCSLPFGIYGLLYFQILLSVIAFYINTLYSGKLINYPVKEQLKDIMPIFILAALTGVVVFLMIHLLNRYLNPGHLLNIMTTGVVYLLIYLGIGYYTKMQAITDIKQLIFKKR